MAEIRYRQPVIELIANRELKKYRGGICLYGNPRPVPIEEMIEQVYDISIEYHHIRKYFIVLGQTVFEDSFIPIYDCEKSAYTAIEVSANTIVIDSRLLQPQYATRLRFTYAHELAHWLLHQEQFKNTGESAALINHAKNTNDNLEREADSLCASILLPKGPVKKAFYSAPRSLADKNVAVKHVAQIFRVSEQATKIRL
ncbi:MAG: ImmA/IrrE family metallo-endopeptidase, partial [Clostridia bacterium]|nr:ImmA/IrrE family metallo-endopeptidase [Clostridia bacterium]